MHMYSKPCTKKYLFKKKVGMGGISEGEGRGIPLWNYWNKRAGNLNTRLHYFFFYGKYQENRTS